MGRNKIQFEKITNEKTRQITYYKRKRGLVKKAMELSVLCGVKVLLCIVDKRNKVNLFSNEKPETFFSEYLKEKIKSKNNLGLEDYPRLFKKQKKIMNRIKTKKKLNVSSVNKNSKFCKKSVNNFEEDDNIEFIDILENSIDSISSAQSTKKSKNERRNNLNKSNDVSFTLKNSAFYNENYYSLDSNCYKISKKRKLSMNNSHIVNGVEFCKETIELDSKINHSTKINAKNSFIFSKNTSFLGDKIKKSRFINKDVTNDIQSIQKVSIINGNEEKTTKSLLIQANLEINIESEKLIINDSVNTSDKSEEKINIHYVKEIHKETNKHNLFNTSDYKMIQSSSVKECPEQFLNNKHNRSNEFMTYNEFLNNIKNVNNLNIFNNQTNEIASHLTNFCSNTNLQNANTYRDVYPPSCMPNQNQLFYHNQPYQKYNDGSILVNEYFDENDFRMLKELEKLIQLQK